MHGFLCSLGFLEAVYYVSLTSHSVCSSHEYFSDEVPARISLPNQATYPTITRMASFKIWAQDQDLSKKSIDAWYSRYIKKQDCCA